MNHGASAKDRLLDQHLTGFKQFQTRLKQFQTRLSQKNVSQMVEVQYQQLQELLKQQQLQTLAIILP